MELGPFVSPSKHDPDVKLFLVEMQRPHRETGEARGNFPQRLPWGLGGHKETIRPVSRPHPQFSPPGLHLSICPLRRDRLSPAAGTAPGQALSTGPALRLRSKKKVPHPSSYPGKEWTSAHEAGCPFFHGGGHRCASPPWFSIRECAPCTWERWVQLVAGPPRKRPPSPRSPGKRPESTQLAQGLARGGAQRCWSLPAPSLQAEGGALSSHGGGSEGWARDAGRAPAAGTWASGPGPLHAAGQPRGLAERLGPLGLGLLPRRWDRKGPALPHLQA